MEWMRVGGQISINLELPRFGGHLITGNAMLVGMGSHFSHPPGLPSDIKVEAVHHVRSSDKSLWVLGAK